ncbi:MAG: transcription termination factor Rho [Nitriliruptoraceae bacterium]
MDRSVLEKKALTELRAIASTLELPGYQRLRKSDLVDLIIDQGGNAVSQVAFNDVVATTSEGASGNSANGDHEAADGARTNGSGGSSGSTATISEDHDDAERLRARRRGGGADDGRADGRSADGTSDDDGQGRDGGDTATRQRTRVRAGERAASSRASNESDDSEDRSAGGFATDASGEEGGSHRSQRDGGGTDSDGDARQRAGRPGGDNRGDDRSQQRGGQRANNGSQSGSNRQAGGQGESSQGDGGQRGSQGGGQSGSHSGGGQGGDDQSGNRNKRDRRRKGRGGQGQGQGHQQQENFDDAEVREGVLDLLPEGYGFLRVTGYLSGNRDVYVSQSFVRRFDLRRGDRVGGPIRRNKNNDKFPALARVDTVEGEEVSQEGAPAKRVEFKDLTPLFPDERLRLEVESNSPIAMRLVDMIAPIGKGQRGLLVSPPKAGKTTVLKQLAHAIEANNPEVHLMVLLVDERPEEVTDFERSTKGEVISSTFDRPAEDHTQVAELTIERAKRLVERGLDVVILLDSITRLGRAYNLAAPASGRILSGGIDSAALYPPKRFFGAARNIEGGGSLTIIASALIDTGSKMDEVIFEEFKGTGNMELRLDRRMEQKRIFPAIDIQASGTRREELLLDPDELSTIWKLRRLLSTMDSEAALQLLIDKLKATKSNSQFLQMIAKSNLQ